MIKLFRHIRQRMIKENRVAKYILYATGEIILVVIGILIALQVNEWNALRKLNTEEIKLLKEMRSALESDLFDVNSNILEHKSAAKSCSILSTVLSDDLPYHDSLNFRFSDALNTTRFGHSSGPYETLKFKGQDLIENDSLRNLITQYYDIHVPYQFDIQDMSFQNFEQAKQRLFELFKGFHLYQEMEPVDFELLKQNQYYKSWLDYTYDLRTWEASRFLALKGKIEELQAQIDKELNKH